MYSRSIKRFYCFEIETVLRRASRSANRKKMLARFMCRYCDLIDGIKWGDTHKNARLNCWVCYCVLTIKHERAFKVHITYNYRRLCPSMQSVNWITCRYYLSDKTIKLQRTQWPLYLMHRVCSFTVTTFFVAPLITDVVGVFLQQIFFYCSFI